MRSGGQIVVDCLEANGVTRIFCVPGESYLEVLDALHDAAIQTVVCRQEGGAAMMADAHARATGGTGICFVTRGPGATNASAGLHIARQDSVPVIVFIGQVARRNRDREAFQEIDYSRMMPELAKWVAEIDDAARIPEYISRAFAVANAGRPGPVVLALPEDMLRDEVDVPAPLAFTPHRTAPGASEMQALAAALAKAERPVGVIGGGGWSKRAVADFTAFAENFDLPVGTSFRRQMLFDHLHPSYAGNVGLGINPELARRVSDADLVLLAGCRLGEASSDDYTLLDVPNPEQMLVHVHAGAEELGMVYRPDIAIHADPVSFAAAAAALVPPDVRPWAEETATAHAEYLNWSTPGPIPGAVQYGEIMGWLSATLPDDAILTNGAGNYAIWLHRYYRFRRFATQAAPACGSMGYGVPAAVAAKLAFPMRTVVAFAGDGCFMMNGQEFATAVQYGAAIVVIVVNNGMFGTIRMHQERRFPGRVSGTGLKNPDFAALARAYGGHGERVEKTADFMPAFERAVASGLPAIIEVMIDPDAIAPTATISGMRRG